jgi:hypothetical protein
VTWIFHLLLALLVATSPVLGVLETTEREELAEHEPEKTEKVEKAAKKAVQIGRAAPPRAIRTHDRTVAFATIERFRDTVSRHAIPPRRLTERRLN